MIRHSLAFAGLWSEVTDSLLWIFFLEILFGCHRFLVILGTSDGSKV